MPSTINSSSLPDKKLAGYCGLFCAGCLIYIATRENEETRKNIAANLNLPVEAVHCDGCRSDERFGYCQQCQIAACAKEKEVEFCGACSQFPCENLESFRNEKAHRLEIFESLETIESDGFETWFDQKYEHYLCKHCQTLNSAYHPKCRNCGTAPGNAFVAKHSKEIMNQFAQRKAQADIRKKSIFDG
jgi:ribosomal protein L40E